MTPLRLTVLTALAMTAFAGNSLLCRLALGTAAMDPASFTSLRLAAGAATLWLIVRLRSGQPPGRGSWGSAAALYAYAGAFSFAYVTLAAGTGALLLFGAVQATMIGVGWWQGERLEWRQLLGLGSAIAGLVLLLWPGVSAPSLQGALLMLAAGVAWGIYSLRGRRQGDPTRVSAGNFLRAVPLALGVSLLLARQATVTTPGLLQALLSGAVTSGIGYALWYTALPHLKGSSAASVQLSVPLIAALAGVLLLGEGLSLRLGVAALAILGGIALVIRGQRA